MLSLILRNLFYIPVFKWNLMEDKYELPQNS